MEFSIYPVPSTSPTLMIFYRIYASELGGLRKQLKDLLEKKFVHPSVSPWGVRVLLVKEMVAWRYVSIIDS